MMTILAILAAYALGSVSSALLLSKFMNLPDPREHGSGNPGATNILRLNGRNMALFVLLGDVFKGLLAVLIGRLFGAHGFGLGLVAVAAVVGHMYPVFFDFRGGKGVATFLGALFGLSFELGLVCFIIWAGVVFLTKYVSLGSLIAVAAATILCLLFGHANYFVPLLIIAGLVGWRHQENIERLKNGTEAKLKL